MPRPYDEGEPPKGQVMVLFALMLVVLLAGLAVILDGGRVYSERRMTQNAADAAAMAGAAKLDTGSLGIILAAACAAAQANGDFGTGNVDGQCGTNGSVVKIHVPGLDGSTALANVNPKFEAPGYVQGRDHLDIPVVHDGPSWPAGLRRIVDRRSRQQGGQRPGRCRCSCSTQPIVRRSRLMAD